MNMGIYEQKLLINDNDQCTSIERFLSIKYLELDRFLLDETYAMSVWIQVPSKITEWT